MTRMRTKQVSASQILPDPDPPRNFITTTPGTTQGLTQRERSPSGYGTDATDATDATDTTDATDGYETDTTASYETDATTVKTLPVRSSPSAAHVDALLEDEMAFGYRPTIGEFKIFTYKHQAPFFV